MMRTLSHQLSLSSFDGVVSTTFRPASAKQKKKKRVKINVPPNPNDSSKIDWQKDVQYAVQTGLWDDLRRRMNAYSERVAAAANAGTEHSLSGSTGQTLEHQENKQQQAAPSSPKSRKAKLFWRRNHSNGSNRSQSSSEVDESLGLMALDADGRTPLQTALACSKAPDDILLTLIDLEQKATEVVDDRGRLALHVAVLHRQHLEVIAQLVESNPTAISALDHKGNSPLTYAVEIAKRDCKVRDSPKSFWMPATPELDEELSKWQKEQTERWSVVHWLLLSSATYPQTSLSVGGRKPMLVEALLHAAPPAVVSLLVGASVMLLSYENHATAFAGSTLYSCITRHYPLSILKSLCSQCPTDVRKVRDETGMGLVAAHFISGCFEQAANTQEWTVSSSMFASLQDSIRDGRLVDDACFVDWWDKVEYLIAFCGGVDIDEEIEKDSLLHLALGNSDVPPCIIRLLLSLYPSAIALPDPATNALPIHLVAGCPDYIPRNYEFQIQILGAEITTTEMVVNERPDAGFCRHERRLALHYAIEAGKTFASIEPFLVGGDDEDCTLLEQRDPFTGLYPFQLAASYNVLSTQNGFRWNCLARNKYSHAVWKGLTDRQKASAILRVAETEDTDRLSTVNELLKRRPTALKPIRAREPASVARDERGMGMVAAHFFSLCFDKYVGGDYEVNPRKTKAFMLNLSEAKDSENFAMTSDFNRWWVKLKFWIRYCLSPQSSSVTAVSYPDIPVDDDMYILHAALANSDTPPQVVDLVLALFPAAPEVNLPESSCLPLHIAAQTVSYTARWFEDIKHSSLQGTLRAHPEAARVDSGDGLPLHIAIRAGKTWRELQELVDVEPRALRVQDEGTGLYPYQMMAATRIQSKVQFSRFQYVLRNQYTEREWQELSPLQKTQETRRVHREYRLECLSTVFALLRREPSLVRTCAPHSASTSRVAAEPHQISKDTVTSRVESVYSTASDIYDDVDNGSGDDGADDDSDCSSDDSGMRSPNSPHRPSALMRLLSRTGHSNEADDVFECDASVLSNVDVMETIHSKSLHSVKSVKREKVKLKPKSQMEEEEVSLSIWDLTSKGGASAGSHSLGSSKKSHSGRSDGDSSAEKLSAGDEDADSSEDNSADEFAEVSVADSSTRYTHTSGGTYDDYGASYGESAYENSAYLESDIESDVSCSKAAYEESEAEDDDMSNDSDSLVYFQMRKQRRSSYKMSTSDLPVEDLQVMSNVRLEKKPDEKAAPSRTHSMPLDDLRRDSLRHMILHKRTASDRNLLGSSMRSCLSGSESYSSLAPEDLGVGKGSDMLWLGSQLLGPQPTTTHTSSSKGSGSLLGSTAHGNSSRSGSSSDFGEDMLSASYAQLRRAGSVKGLVLTESSSKLSRSKSDHKDKSDHISSRSTRTSRSDESYNRSFSTERSFATASDASTNIGILEFGDSYSTFASEDMAQNNPTGMAWVSNQIYESTLGAGSSQSADDTESDLLDEVSYKFVTGGQHDRSGRSPQPSTGNASQSVTSQSETSQSISVPSAQEIERLHSSVDMLWIDEDIKHQSNGSLLLGVGDEMGTDDLCGKLSAPDLEVSDRTRPAGPTQNGMTERSRGARDYDQSESSTEGTPKIDLIVTLVDESESEFSAGLSVRTPESSRDAERYHEDHSSSIGVEVHEGSEAGNEQLPGTLRASAAASARISTDPTAKQSGNSSKPKAPTQRRDSDMYFDKKSMRWQRRESETRHATGPQRRESTLSQDSESSRSDAISQTDQQEASLSWQRQGATTWSNMPSQGGGDPPIIAWRRTAPEKENGSKQSGNERQVEANSKTEMLWERQVSKVTPAAAKGRDQGEAATGAAGGSLSNGSKTTSQVQKIFDKKTMRWVPAPASDDSSQASSTSSRQSAGQRKPDGRSAVSPTRPGKQSAGAATSSSPKRGSKKPARTPLAGSPPQSPSKKSVQPDANDVLQETPKKQRKPASTLESITEDQQLIPTREDALKLTGQKPKPSAPFVGPPASRKNNASAKEKASHISSTSMTLGRAPSASSLPSESKNLCLLCDHNPSQVLLVPCRHLSVCRQCSALRKEMDVCPLCKGPVTDRMLIFDSGKASSSAEMSLSQERWHPQASIMKLRDAKLMSASAA